MKFNFLNDENGEQSSKRLFTFILVQLFVVYFFANLFFKLELKESFEDSFIYLVVFMYAGVLLEKAPFFRKKITDGDK